MRVAALAASRRLCAARCSSMPVTVGDLLLLLPALTIIISHCPGASAVAAAAATAATKPHLVYVLSDNLGWGNVGYHRAASPSGPSPEVVTPNIDHLVATGIELDRLYTYKFCSPSRAALLSGRFPLHVNLHNKALSIPVRSTHPLL